MRWNLWLQAELIAMGTEPAEVVGAAIVGFRYVLLRQFAV
jgi:Mn2+/Fe2+ NRAMP family transporter